MSWAGLVAFVKRNKTSIIDGTFVIGVLAVVTYLAFEIRIFVTEDTATSAQQTLELNEALLIGALMTVGLLIFGLRRHISQRRELARRIAAEHQARELAYQDTLTGLPNRRQFDEALKEAVGSPPGARSTHAVFLMDLNGFKLVNDVYGHNIGDEVLIVVGQRLLSAVRDGDLVARLGGDEFGVVARHLDGVEGATNIARRIIQQMEAPITTGDSTHALGTAIGISLVPGDATTVDEAFRRADVALYRAKAERRSAVRFFEADMDRSVQERSRTEAALREAIANNQIRALFLPTVDLKTGRIVGFETAPRWIHPELGEMLPEQFMPIAEEAGLIHELAARLLREACLAAVTWPEHVQLSCDIYAAQLRDPSLPERMIAILNETGLAPERLELDITEAAVVRDLESARTAFSALREVGIRIALDNFGTGYSSLYHLRSVKLDKVKIDSSFVRGMAGDRENAGIVNALVGLGHGLGLAVSAKGVASGGQHGRLLDSGCDEGQLSGQPVTAGATLDLLASPQPN